MLAEIFRPEELDSMEETLKRLADKLDDHDILIELRTTQRSMSTEMRTMAEGITATVQDHERRLRIMERLVFYGAGAAGLATVMYKLMKP